MWVETAKGNLYNLSNVTAVQVVEAWPDEEGAARQQCAVVFQQDIPGSLFASGAVILAEAENREQAEAALKALKECLREQWGYLSWEEWMRQTVAHLPIGVAEWIAS